MYCIWLYVRFTSLFHITGHQQSIMILKDTLPQRFNLNYWPKLLQLLSFPLFSYRVGSITLYFYKGCYYGQLIIGLDQNKDLLSLDQEESPEWQPFPEVVIHLHHLSMLFVCTSFLLSLVLMLAPPF